MMKKYALVGKRLSYSYSKRIHEFLMSSFDCFEEGVYDLVEMDKVLHQGVLSLPCGYDGFNITNPFKRELALYFGAFDKGEDVVIAPSYEKASVENALSHSSILSDSALYRAVLQESVNTLESRSGSVEPSFWETVERNDRRDAAADSCGRWSVANTDVGGFLYAFGDMLQECETVCILGRGATSKMVQAIAGRYSKRVVVIGREGLGRKPEDDIGKILLVNCTPIGTRRSLPEQGVLTEKIRRGGSEAIRNHSNERRGDGLKKSPLDLFSQQHALDEFSRLGIKEESIRRFSGVADLVYNPERTPLVALAEDSGISAKSGLIMLIAQAVLAQQFWNRLTKSGLARGARLEHSPFFLSSLSELKRIVDETHSALFSKE